MRTIGQRNIKKLEALVDQVYKENKDAGFSTSREVIMQRVPETWLDIWESAWSEINRIIDDRLWKNVYNRV